METQSTEPAVRVTREEVIAAYKKFSDRGLGDPSQIDSSDPESRRAVELENAWAKWEEQESKDDPEMEIRHNNRYTMLWVDAGFTGINYLYDVRGWLWQDAHNAERIPGNATRAESRNLIAEGIRRVSRVIESCEAFEGVMAAEQSA